ncbi:conserved hypothetical protein [Ricinus communis]|uniref:DUF985 domain-containing protein n=1 Tax=Ricinus communis TaxID=3988 RepID=B9RR80_RICCO|nr:conserved hypothetical protein [Ricinus communis]
MAFLFGRTFDGLEVRRNITGKLIQLHPAVKLTCLGSDLIGANQQPQYTVPPNVWFGAFPTNDYIITPDEAVAKAAPRDTESHYSLVGCTCAPAFQFEDFELAKRSELISRFPNHEHLISLMTFPDNVVYPSGKKCKPEDS